MEVEEDGLGGADSQPAGGRVQLVQVEDQLVHQHICPAFPGPVVEQVQLELRPLLSLLLDGCVVDGELVVELRNLLVHPADKAVYCSFPNTPVITTASSSSKGMCSTEEMVI
eukprot:GGOE01010082.1.p3 GENE.GGOE01010082.1~~GGOE01010082.1.p3  ORF type:complete len:112 (-),score=28.87 GGOE01010082.1:64-399(-)